MSKIDDLISKYCPNGVEYRKISEIAKVSIGEFVHKNNQNPNGLYPVYNGGTSNTGYYDEFNNTANKIIISARGANAGFVNKVLVDYWAGNSCYTIDVVSDELDWNFVYYFLKNSEKSLIGQQQTGSIPAVSKKQIETFKIPLPPLSVQQEIVRILDGFSELEKELEKELVARRKQYEYYRNQLVSFGEGGDHACDVKLVKLEDLFELRNGYTPSKTNSSFWEDGTIPWFRMEDIRTNGRILSDSIQHITNKAVKQGALFPADSIIVAVSATIGEHALITVEALANQRFVCLSKKEEYINDLNMKYFYYYMFLIDEWCKNNTNVSGFASVDMAKFKKIQIPIPPLAEQERIVAILDKFDALVNDISVGLPAELKARRKQYEYWRNKLLSFEEVA